ncbi:MAG: hypothetical protein NZ920_00285 [Aigarchaeota archaeon]|nr:hypothetical protein [Aigarchaeota archaeon]MDW8092753.1 V-type ATPase 116kDa subunit family protein [Nitrososphaerota archaeon]
MPVEQLLRARVVTTRTKAEQVLDKLYSFGYFHPEEREGGRRLDEIYRVYVKARTLSIDIENVTKQLELSEGPGVIDVLLRGDDTEQLTLNVNGLSSLLSKLETESSEILPRVRLLLEEREKLREELNELRSVATGLSSTIRLKVNLKELKEVKRFYLDLFIAPIKAVPELTRSLEGCYVLSEATSDRECIVLLIAKPTERARVERVAESLGLKKLIVPEWLLGPLPEAYARLNTKIGELEKRLEELEAKVTDIKANLGDKLLAMRDAARILKDSLDRFLSEPLKRAAVIEGYVPVTLKDQFVRVLGDDAYVELGEVRTGHPHNGHKVPSFLKQSRFIRPYTNVTKLQGIPGYGEIDPTPLVAIFFSIFYGIMFADFGQGLVILLGGLIIWRRARDLLKTWGMLLVLLGSSATIGGLLIQEAFGFSLSGMFPFPPVIKLLDHSQGHGSASFNVGAVLLMFQFALLLGFTHVTIGLILSTYTYLKKREFAEGITKGISTVMYFFGLLFGIAFVGAGGFDEILTSNNPAPLLGVPAGQIGSIAVPALIACIILLLISKPILMYSGIGHREKIGSVIGASGMELMENILSFISNTLSYLRLVILLLVHIVLMLLVNSALGIGIAGIPILVIGNMGVIALEGMVAFLQALRLHVYEFFTKFYEGAGTPFQPLLIRSRFVNVLIGPLPQSR